MRKSEIFTKGKSGDKGHKKRNKRYQAILHEKKKTVKIVQTSERSPQAGESQRKVTKS